MAHLLGGANIAISPALQINGITVLTTAGIMGADTGFTAASQLQPNTITATMVGFGGSGPVQHDQISIPLIYDNNVDAGPGTPYNITATQTRIGSVWIPDSWVGDCKMGIVFPAKRHASSMDIYRR